MSVATVVSAMVGVSVMTGVNVSEKAVGVAVSCQTAVGVDGGPQRLPVGSAAIQSKQHMVGVAVGTMDGSRLGVKVGSGVGVPGTV